MEREGTILRKCDYCTGEYDETLYSMCCDPFDYEDKT